MGITKKEKRQKQKEDTTLHKEKQAELYKKSCEMHNKAPVTRRDFLGAGLISFGTYFTRASLSSLFLPIIAAADECPTVENSGPALSAFVTLSLAGGWGGASNFLPMNSGGGMLSDYRKLGLGRTPPVEREFGNVPFVGNGISGFLEGIRETAGAGTIGRTAFVAIPNQSQNDSNENQLDSSGMVAKAGLLGENLPNLGTIGSPTGTKHVFALVKPPNPLRVSSYNSIANALGAGQGALASMSKKQQIDLFNAVKKLSDRQVASLSGDSGGKMLAHLVKCATGHNLTAAQNATPSLDVRQHPTHSGVWGVTAGTGANNMNVRFGSMVVAALTGAAGTVGLEMGGYDYHDSTRTTGDRKDKEAGQVIGRILESAARENKKVFINIISDGGVNSPVSNSTSAPWVSEGESGILMFLAYDPAGRPETSKFQIGHFTNAQAADTSFITGENESLAAAAVFANYLKFNGRMDLLEQVIPGTFNTQQLNQVLAIA